jgi:hypothetical protein
MNGMITTPDFTQSMHTTRTLIYSYDGLPNLEPIGQTLPLTVVTLPKPWKRGTKPKLKQLPEMGSIYCIRHPKFFRGLWGPPFKNSVMIDISMGNKKSVNVKISKQRFHICGLTSNEQGVELIEMLINLIHDAQKKIHWFNEHPDVFNAVASTMLSNIGPPITVITYNIIKVLVRNKMKDRRFPIGTKTVEQFLIGTVDDLCQRIPELPLEYATWIHSLFKECNTMDDVQQRIEDFRIYFPMEICQSPLVLNPISQHVMYNCSYNLGFCIDCQKLLRAVNELNLDDVEARYNSALDYYVTVDIKCNPSELTSNRVLISKKKMASVNSFLIYPSSYCMQSSKSHEGMLEAFYIFRTLIMSIKDDIIDNEETQHVWTHSSVEN